MGKRGPQRGHRPAVVAVVVAAAVAIFLAARALTGPDAGSAAESFLDAWSRGDYSAAGARTDGDGAAVAKVLEEHVEGLDGAALATEVEGVSEEGDAATASVEMAWDVPRIGRWTYATEVELVRGDDDWLVRFAPETVHPELEGDERLGTVSELPERAPILGGDGKPIVSQRPVVAVGVVPERAKDTDEAVAAVAASTDADRRALGRSVDAAEPETFVEAIVLRRDDFAAVEDELSAVPGVVFSEREAPLAESREFARALLGAVAPATAEQLEELGGTYTSGDQVGQSGLQAAFQEELAGAPTGRVVVRSDGVPVETLHEVEGERGEPLETTLDADVQRAAEEALGSGDRKAALVAVDASSGDLLAVANRPVDDTFDRALEGRYPPGSTFKVVTTAALLATGEVDPSTTVDCPRFATVGGVQFQNFESGSLGPVPFREIFAESCNTGFVSLADELGAESLPDAAADFGLERDLALPVAAFLGDVPATPKLANRAAAMIGQDRVLVSPLGLAGVAATVADGRWRSPRLLASDERSAGEPLPSRELSELRDLTRLVVTSGTGTALAGVSGEVHGKSGTAEYGSGDPPPTHAWFIAYRGDVAISVLVEDGRSGGSVAAPIAADFFEALGAAP